jgi:hypothetical protein
MSEENQEQVVNPEPVAPTVDAVEPTPTETPTE